MSAWPNVALGTVAEINRIGVDPRMLAPGTKYVGLEDIASGGSSVHPVILANGDLASTKFRFTEEHLLFGKLRPYLAKIVSVDFAGVCSTDILPILPGPSIDREYLRHYLLQPSVVAYAASLASGANLPRLSPAALMALPIPLPPFPEQRRIADILDRADALRAKRRAAIANLDTLTQSIFLDMFGDPVANPRGWKRVPFGSILANIDSGQSPTCLDRPAGADEWGVLKLGAVTYCEYNSAANKALPAGVAPSPPLEVHAGDLLFTRKNTRDLVGACVLVSETPPRLMIPDLIFRFRLNADAGVVSTYLHRLLIYPTKRRAIQNLAGGSAGSMPNISKERLRGALIERPPLDLQIKFGQRAETVHAIKSSCQASLTHLDTLFASLQHRAFRGEL